MPAGTVLARHPRAIHIYIVLVSLLAAAPALAHDDPSAQIDGLTREAKASAHPAAFLVRRGELRRQEGDWRGALADFDAAAALDPGLDDLELRRGVALLDGGEAAGALLSLERFLFRHPEHAEALWLRGRARVALGRRQEAVWDFGAALRGLHRVTPDHYLERARAQVALGETSAARAGLDEGIRRLGPAPAILEMASRLGEIEARPPSPAPARTPAPTTELLLVPRGSVWRYDATGTDLGSAWRAPGYDDSLWPSGPAPLGYGDPFIVTTVPSGPASNKYVTTYFRTTFAFSGSASSLTLRANYDDGFVAYLNGQEVARRGLGTGAVPYGLLAVNHEGGAYETIDVTPSAGLLVAGQNSFAVEVHQQAVTSSDLAMDLELAATEAGVPSLTRGPYLQVGTPTSVVVRWRTDVPAPSLVRYGLDIGALADSVFDLTLTTEHELTLAGLAPTTRYYYEVAADTLVLAGADTSCTFVTAPPTGTLAATRVWVLGDSGLPGPNQNAVRDAYTSYTGARGTDVWLMLGDNAYQTGTDAEFQGAVFDPYASLLRQWVLWPTRGNHEFLNAGPGNDYYDFFTLPIAAEAGGYPSGDEAYYSFDHANIHFVCLDSEGSSRDTTMLSWLESDLASAQSDWVIAFWHHPPYTKGSHNSDDTLDSGGRMRDMRELALPILESWGVDLVLTGHSHSYERSYLLDEHYDVSSTLVDSMKVDGGDGRVDGTGPYLKAALGLAPHQGAVYAVAGSGSQISGGLLNHPAMVVSLNQLGSLVVDVVGNRLDALFLGADGAHRDSFTVVKGATVSAPRPAPRPMLRLAPAAPNPFRATTRIPYDLPRAGAVSVEVFDLRGRRVATLTRGEQAAGPHEIAWDGRDTRGRALASGAYFMLLRFEDQSRVSRVVRVE